MSLQPALSPRNRSTVIIEPHVLLRDSLAALITGYSYRVVGSYASAQQIKPNDEQRDVRLVILGVHSMDQALDESSHIRKTFPSSKVLILLEHMSAEDFRKLSESTIDACVPLDASRDILMWTLEILVSDAARVVVLEDPPIAMQQKLQTERSGEANGNARQKAGEPAKVSHVAKPVTSLRLASGHMPVDVLERAGDKDFANSVPEITDGQTIHLAPPANELRRAMSCDSKTVVQLPRISDRELQVLEGLVKGYGNKMIARECKITEATVKVHMKSILRKIQATNRTQAAVWAIEHGFCAGAPPMVAPSAAQAAAAAVG